LSNLDGFALLYVDFPPLLEEPKELPIDLIFDLTFSSIALTSSNSDFLPSLAESYYFFMALHMFLASVNKTVFLSFFLVPPDKTLFYIITHFLSFSIYSSMVALDAPKFLRAALVLLRSLSYSLMAVSSLLTSCFLLVSNSFLKVLKTPLSLSKSSVLATASDSDSEAI